MVSICKFFVNDILLWQGINTTYSSGRVGVFSWPDMTCDDYWCEVMHGIPGRTYVDSFYLGAPDNQMSLGSEVLQPNPAYGTSPEKSKKKITQ